jgi:hypothetical protein
MKISEIVKNDALRAYALAHKTGYGVDSTLAEAFLVMTKAVSMMTVEDLESLLADARPRREKTGETYNEVASKPTTAYFAAVVADAELSRVTAELHEVTGELAAVMQSVDKWLPENARSRGSNPATRAAHAREYALRAIEDLDHKLDIVLTRAQRTVAHIEIDGVCAVGCPSCVDPVGQLIRERDDYRSIAATRKRRLDLALRLKTIEIEAAELNGWSDQREACIAAVRDMNGPVLSYTALHAVLDAIAGAKVTPSVEADEMETDQK